MFIGQVAKLSGASRKAIRHYESIGLIMPPPRKGSYRVYQEHDVKVIIMIRRAQALGFSLAELKDVVLKKTQEHRLPFDLVFELIEQKQVSLQLEIEQLQTKIKRLTTFKSDLIESFS